MPVITSPEQFNVDDLYVDLAPLDLPLLLKCEGFNFAGSIKLKAAAAMISAAELAGRLRPDTVLVESSSGNLGVAMAMIAAGRGLRFLCVTDPRCNLASLRLMEAFGAQVHVVSQCDADGGFLGARIAHVRALCSADERYVWLDQYTNAHNWRAHHRHTAPAIAAAVPNLGVLFVGAGTAGTLMGCARWFRESGKRVTVVAVDAEGSVLFDDQPGPRMIPGLGSALRSPMLDRSLVDDVVLVSERDTVRACHRLAGAGYLFGGSTGTVVAGARQWLSLHGIRPGVAAVAIAPDLAERYLDTIYQSTWIRDVYGEDILDQVDMRAG